jgi:hypothetical protein
LRKKKRNKSVKLIIYHRIRKWKTKNTTLSEPFQNTIVESETCSISLNYILLLFCIMYLHICIVSHTKLKDVHTLNREIYTLPIFFNMRKTWYPCEIHCLYLYSKWYSVMIGCFSSMSTKFFLKSLMVVRPDQKQFI